MWTSLPISVHCIVTRSSWCRSFRDTIKAAHYCPFDQYSLKKEKEGVKFYQLHSCKGCWGLLFGLKTQRAYCPLPWNHSQPGQMVVFHVLCRCKKGWTKNFIFNDNLLLQKNSVPIVVQPFGGMVCFQKASLLQVDLQLCGVCVYDLFPFLYFIRTCKFTVLTEIDTDLIFFTWNKHLGLVAYLRQGYKKFWITLLTLNSKLEKHVTATAN